MATSAGAEKTERLMNLLLALLVQRRAQPKSRLRAVVPQYADLGDDAFDRMFDRDKDDLRSLGVPLVTVSADPLFEDEPAYRVDRGEYELPPIEFTNEEMAVIGLAGRSWNMARLAGPAADALRKLTATGAEDASAAAGLEPRVRTSEDAFEPMLRATVDMYPIRFAYRRGGAPGQATTRHVRPWGLASWHGRWYLTGFDVDRDDVRVFRLDRVDGPVERAGEPGTYEVPADHEPRALVRRRIGTEPLRRARVRLRHGRAHTLRRRAVDVAPAPGPWTDVTVEFDATDTLADEVCGYGPDVVALDPPELVDAVVARLRGCVDAHTPKEGTR